MIQLIDKIGNIKKLLEQAVENGYGDLPAVWAIKLWLVRN